MDKDYINKQLREAVNKDDVDGVRRWLDAGADPNQHTSYSEGSNSLLHLTYNVDILKLLLKSGACVNAYNRSSESPLRTTSEQSKSAEFVEELLKHGAQVNATDRHGNTPLLLLLNRGGHPRKNVQVLLEYGADINIGSRDRDSSLCLAMYYPSVAKMLIRYTLFNNFNKDYTRFVNLSRFKNDKHYGRYYEELSNYCAKCVAELQRMERDLIIENCSLYNLITRANMNFDTYSNDAEKKCIRDGVFEALIGCSHTIKYPIYYEIMSARISRRLLEKREILLNIVSEIEISTKNMKGDDEGNAVEKNVVLDFYTKQVLAKYLSNKDLLNLFMAFYKCTNQCAVELEQIKKDLIADNCSLYDLLTVENMNSDILYYVNDVEKKCIKNEVFEILSGESYSIYNEIISAKLESRLLEERESLLHKISEIEISTKFVRGGNEGNAIKQNVSVILDFYTKQEISKYLSNRDLLNLSVAFYNYRNQCTNLNNSFASASETKNAISPSNEAKRVKLT